MRIIILSMAVAGAAVAVWARVSPYPSSTLVRWVFDAGGRDLSARLERHVPPGISSRYDIIYDPFDPDAQMDLYRQTAISGPRPVIVWVHGGGWVSGSRAAVANYLRILAGEGFVTIAVGYSRAPGAQHPTPVRQVNAALAFIAREAVALGVDPAQIILAGDSAGAQIAAQVANLATAPAYAAALGVEPRLDAASLRGTILFCGFFEHADLGWGGLLGFVGDTVLWAYSGHRNPAAGPKFGLASVPRHVTSAFPPAFISAGNGDPLEGQSKAFAERLRALDVSVDTLFFAPDRTPALPHVYQFSLDNAAGRIALTRATDFARRVTAPP